mmetsp:Transcript_27915/g.47764  ORF Transcript_27915/g.47764 Transcript_27915/m.47764 type:complete len:210 (-) Transcript_27915:738-1367(-)
MYLGETGMESRSSSSCSIDAPAEELDAPRLFFCCAAAMAPLVSHKTTCPVMHPPATRFGSIRLNRNVNTSWFDCIKMSGLTNKRKSHNNTYEVWVCPMMGIRWSKEILRTALTATIPLTLGTQSIAARALNLEYVGSAKFFSSRNSLSACAPPPTSSSPSKRKVSLKISTDSFCCSACSTCTVARSKKASIMSRFSTSAVSVPIEAASY